MAERAPSEKMIESAKAAAARHGVDLPKGFDKEFAVCSKFLDVYLKKPSPKALALAERIAKDKGVEIPAEALAEGKVLSAWIDANKG